MVQNAPEAVILIVAALLTCFGVIFQIIVCRLLSGERKRVRRLSEKWPETAKSEWKSDPAAVLSRYGVAPTTLTGRHVVLASKALNVRNPPSASDLTAVIEDSTRSWLIHTLPNALLSVLLILGVAGTIYILRDVLGGDQFQKIIGKDAELSTDQLQTALRTIYGGFGRAFISSLCGIFGTVVLVLSRAFFVRPAELRFFADIQKLTIEDLQPTFQRDELTVPEALERAARSSEVTAEKFSTCVQQLSGTIEGAAVATTELGQNVTKFSGFASMMGKAGKSLERATVALEELFSESGNLRRLFTTQEESSVVLTKALNAVANEVNTHSGQIGTLVQWHEQVSKLIESGIAAGQLAAEKQLSALSALELLPNITRFVETSAANQAETAKHLAALQTLPPLLRNLEAVSSNVSGLLDLLSALQRTLVQTGENHIAAQQIVAEEMQKIGSKLEALQSTDFANGGRSRHTDSTHGTVLVETARTPPTPKYTLPVDSTSGPIPSGVPRPSAGLSPTSQSSGDPNQPFVTSSPRVTPAGKKFSKSQVGAAIRSLFSRILFWKSKNRPADAKKRF